MRTFTFPSKSSPGVTYQTSVGDDGLASCTCPGWLNLRAGQPRTCTHCKQVAAQLGQPLIERGGFVYVADPTRQPQPTAAAALPDRAPPAPMLAMALPTPVEGQAFDVQYGDGQWVMEEKLDGHRVLVVVEQGRVAAFSRPQAGQAPKPRVLPPEIAGPLGQWFPTGVYDGELCVPNGTSSDVAVNGASLVYVLFDLLAVEGLSWMGEPYAQRRAGLELIMGRLAPHLSGTPVQLARTMEPRWAHVEAIWARGGEGAMLKHRASRYRAGTRSAEWVKVKKEAVVATTIVGYNDGALGPHSVVRVQDGEGVEFTVKTKNNDLLRQMDADPERFLGRTLVVSYIERTKDGRYRSPMWHSLMEGDQ